MKRFLWLLAIGCWIGCAFYVDYVKNIRNPTGADIMIYFSLSAMGWIFLIFAIGGRKGLPFVAGLVTFVICFFLFGWVVIQIPKFFGCNSHDLIVRLDCAKRLLDTLKDKPFTLLVTSSGILLGVLGVLIFPIFVGKKVNKIFGGIPTVPHAVKAEEREREMAREKYYRDSKEQAKKEFRDSARTWTKDRIKEEIADLRREIAELRENIQEDEERIRERETHMHPGRIVENLEYGISRMEERIGEAEDDIEFLKSLL